jgi:hypothetical protein
LRCSSASSGVRARTYSSPQTTDADLRQATISLGLWICQQFRCRQLSHMPVNNPEPLYEAALSRVSRADESAKADALKAFERVDQIVNLIHKIRTYGTPGFGFSAAIIAIIHLIGWGYPGFHADYWLATPVASALGWVIALLVLARLSMSLWDILLNCRASRICTQSPDGSQTKTL